MNRFFNLMAGSAILLGAAFGCKSNAPQNASSTVNLYVGTYTSGSSQGIYQLKFDTVTGVLTHDTLAAKINNPSFIALSANGNYLAAVSEDDSRAAMLYTFAVDKGTGLLTPLSEIETGGFGPCYVSTLGDTLICTANYRSGTVCFTKVDANGKVLGHVQSFVHQGVGVNTERQEKPHAHSIVPDLDGKFVYSANLGVDKIYVYQPQADTMATAKEIAVSPGFGPRHIAFHPSKKWMALANELTSTVELYAKDDQGIFSVKTASLPLLPDTVSGANTAADIHFSPDGKFLYATNRGFDFIAVMSIDETAQTLQLVERNHGLLNWPRNFAIDPTGKFVLVANQKGNNIVVFSRDAQSGKLTDTGNRFSIDSPVCLKF